MKIHIAGYPLKIGTKGRQLCAWCGERLFDVDHANEMCAPNADGSPGEGSRPWEPGTLIAHEGNGWWVVPHEDGAQIPPRACYGPPVLRAIPGSKSEVQP
jgi:hypothetical protein